MERTCANSSGIAKGSERISVPPFEYVRPECWAVPIHAAPSKEFADTHLVITILPSDHRKRVNVKVSHGQRLDCFLRFMYRRMQCW